MSHVPSDSCAKLTELEQESNMLREQAPTSTAVVRPLEPARNVPVQGIKDAPEGMMESRVIAAYWSRFTATGSSNAAARARMSKLARAGIPARPACPADNHPSIS
ncbi:MAG: hypothetical protein Q6373_019835 [Candidatus Sigynarchaeota archaeon]